jgi:acetate kinase
MKVLVINAGSSSLKYQLLNMENEQLLATGIVQRIGSDDAIFEYKVPGGKDLKEVCEILDHTTAIKRMLGALTNPEYGVVSSPAEIDAVGHRVVHGGEAFTGSVLITDAVKDMMKSLIDIAPLHNPANLTGIAAAEAALPGKPQVGVFDTSFHQTMPRKAFLYALPYAMYKRHKVRRYGFHGTSHRYVAERLAEHMGGSLVGKKVITCHLGNGSSCAAILDGQSVDTSMGLGPLEGLIMGTRSGDLDPGAIFYIMAKEELTPNEMSSMLNKHSGMRGVSGISGDMRQIEEEMEKGDERAKETFDMVEYRLRKYIGSYAAAMNGVDAIIFTGGIGENSNTLRGAVCHNLSYLGVEIDDTVNNTRSKQERTISTPNSKVQVWVIPTNEELVIARDTRDVVNSLKK